MIALTPFARWSALARLARPYAAFGPAVAGLGLTATALEACGVGLMAPLLGLLMSAPTADMGVFGRVADAIPAGRRALALTGLVFAFILAKNLAAIANQLIIAKLEAAFGHRLRSDLARRLVTAPYPFFLLAPPARLVNVVSGESWRVSEAMRQHFVLVASAAAAAAFGLLLLLVEWRLAILVGTGALVIRQVEKRLAARTSGLSRAVTAANDRLARRMLIGVLATRLVRVFGQERREAARFEAASHEVGEAVYRVWRTGGSMSPILEILHAALFAAVLAAALHPAMRISLPVLAVFLILLQRTQPHLRLLEAARVQLAAVSGSAAEVEWLLGAAGAEALPAPGDAPATLAREIRFEGVSFDYGAGSGPALHEASFVIRAGSRTALNGPSGAGKSTIVNLLCRLLEPTAGRILVDGVPLAGVDLGDWRAGIGLAGQDIELVDGTIAENIAYGVPGLDRAGVEAAARLADAAGFIVALPQGYDTEVGPRGLSLSGGQRQRIALARALARRPRLLILDEATSEVDAESERTIMGAPGLAQPGMTVVVISHRPSALAGCDAQLVVAGGRVVEASPS
jgi:subfamily B ATP-binding cassette protein MsbA